MTGRMVHGALCHLIARSASTLLIHRAWRAPSIDLARRSGADRASCQSLKRFFASTTTAPSAATAAATATATATAASSLWQQLGRYRDSQGSHDVVLALGSNVGDRYANIKRALLAIEQTLHDHSDAGGQHPLITSALYETAPKYVEDQPRFLNAVCKIRTLHSPHELLDRVKKLEQNLGRQPRFRNGPREIDIDIILHGLHVVRDGDHLEVPHPRLTERDFVLKPLCDISPHLVHPVLGKTVQELCSALEQRTQGISRADAMYRVLPVGSTMLPLGRQTHVMSIINTTPDSFSDGGKWTKPDLAVTHATSLLAAGSAILDIGGQSTRPNAEYVSEEEESRRVVPVITSLAAHSGKTPVLLSIDTFRASVAKAAIQAGAHIINDVSAGTMSKEMLHTAAALQVPIVLMHMRGDSGTMTSLATYSNDRPIAEQIADELRERVAAAVFAGVWRWNIIVDPGIGFAKAGEHNFPLLTQLRQFAKCMDGLPTLVGPSRKRFLALAAQSPELDTPEHRRWATAAAVTACVDQGVDIVRVHDGPEMISVARTADLIYNRVPK
ncbi:folic acid synthesis protein [Capsaspora owczarzaki ATCC 30864]|uniref:Folic acid synthesis protein n=1 Tax=Capsaspora owczarzaki (strain ATCC 30864) TaxID=595528 RepID=A0A0D2VFC6_CAPO3|nr:folic acid synthesis protein [Capsaspora owczarzaki ATCC 30864]KJE88427.1 folic acid synthesis protein [Capsaspora owczarzaki ATCC 30864]|eukprot:XP_004364957.1 folic acid synthesis protein [Capsaspora owczarzaki ATCC 30864]